MYINFFANNKKNNYYFHVNELHYEDYGVKKAKKFTIVY